MREQPLLSLTDRETAITTEQPALPPHVSIIIPCFNEERFIGKVLENVSRQTEIEKYEVVLMDGMSTDGTRGVIANFAANHPEIKVKIVDNPTRRIPAALNSGVREARGEIIVRLDAHAVPSENYVGQCVKALDETGVSVVGMPIRIRPGRETAVARAISLAVGHAFGIGDAKYRMPHGIATQYVDTVPFGAFRKDLWVELGGFNEKLLTNEDYDFYYRARRQGGRVLLDTAAHCVYFARATYGDLARQYYRYGLWKAQMIKLHPSSLKPRQIVAPVFVAALILLPLIGLWWKPALLLFLLMMLAYLSLSLISAVRLAHKEGKPQLVSLISWAFFVIHLSWGGSFLFGLLHSPRR